MGGMLGDWGVDLIPSKCSSDVSNHYSLFVLVRGHITKQGAFEIGGLGVAEAFGRVSNAMRGPGLTTGAVDTDF